MKCEGCGRNVTEVGYFLGPCYSHEKGDVTCLKNQLFDAKQRIKKLENVAGEVAFDMPEGPLKTRLLSCLTPKQ